MSLLNGKIAHSFLLPLTILSATAFPAQDREATEQELAAVTAAVADIQSWLGAANTRHSEERNRLREIELTIAGLHERVGEVQNRVRETEARLADLERERAALNDFRQRQGEALATILRTAYMTGNTPALKFLLTREDPGDVARLLHYARLFSEQQVARLEAYRRTLEELQSLDTTLQTTLSGLNEQRRRLAHEISALDEARVQRQQALADLNADIGSRRAELEQLQIDQAELQALLEEIARAMEGVRSFADVPPFTEQRGRLPAPTVGAISSRFGSAYGGGSLTRQGIILRANPGAPVRAVHAGRVVFADWLRGAGLLVIIDHGDGYMSLYGGNEALGVEAGDWVDGGQVVATSGPGITTGEPGLYFEIRHQGQAVDPANWLSN